MPTLKAIHIAKSLKNPAAQAKLVNKYVFANADRKESHGIQQWLKNIGVLVVN